MVKSLGFKRLQFNNYFKGYRTAFRKDAEAFPKKEAAFVRRRARTRMRRAPSNPKLESGAHGFFKPYKTKSYERRVNKYRAGNAKRPGRGFWRKGLYSRPGSSPFHHGQQFNLRFIIFKPINVGNVNIPHKRGGSFLGYRVGPKYDKKPWQSTPIPQLHEHGGQINLRKKGLTYKDKWKRNSLKMRRESQSKAIYPPRPYMAPAGVEAHHSAKGKTMPGRYRIMHLGEKKNTRLPKLKTKRLYG